MATRVMGIHECVQPSTGHTILVAQVLDLPDDDAKALVAAGHVVESDAPVTADVGALLARRG